MTLLAIKDAQSTIGMSIAEIIKVSLFYFKSTLIYFLKSNFYERIYQF